MTIYCIDDKEGFTILAALILLKYDDTNSLKKFFSILSELYNFSLYALQQILFGTNKGFKRNRNL